MRWSIYTNLLVVLHAKYPDPQFNSQDSIFPAKLHNSKRLD